MPILNVIADYATTVRFDPTYGYYKFTMSDDIRTVYVGYYSKSPYPIYRIPARFPLNQLPNNITITQARLRLNCTTQGGSAHQLDIHPYNDNGQADPEVDGAEICYNRCSPAGTPYIDNSIALRTTGLKWFDLGNQACQDILNAKNAVNQFAFGLHEEGDNDAFAIVEGLKEIWINCTGHQDPDNGWIDDTEAYAHDGSPTSDAISNPIPPGSWSKFLYLTIPQVKSNKIRLSILPYYIWDIDVYRDGVWVDVFYDVVTTQYWHEVSFDTGYCTQVRARMYNDAGLEVGARLYEIQFWELREYKPLLEITYEEAPPAVVWGGDTHHVQMAKAILGL